MCEIIIFLLLKLQKLKNFLSNLIIKKIDQNNGIAPYFLEVVRDELKKWANDSEKPGGGKYDIYEDGLRIYTTHKSTHAIVCRRSCSKEYSYTSESIERDKKALKQMPYGKDMKNILEAAMKATDRWKGLKEDGASEEEIRASFKKKCP